MTEVASLAFPNKSHRKQVRLPPESSVLAEFFGIMLGDGGINNDWQANVTLNTDADATYISYVTRVMEKLFHVCPAIRPRRTQRATVVSLASTSVVDFLVNKGLPRGNKLIQGLSIPQWILDQKAYKIACVRGLVDTDGCLVLHAHSVAKKTYINLYLLFSSASPELRDQVTDIFTELGLTPRLAHNKKEICLYRSKEVQTYMQIVGTSNSRIRRVYEKWRDG